LLGSGDVAVQATLVSGTNIKTVNGNTLLGSGDLVITGGGGGGMTATSIKTTAYTAVANDLVRVNSSGGAFTVTLPSAPTDGDQIGVIDVNGACGTNAVLIAAAGAKTVEGDATGLSLDIGGATVILRYNSATNNWKNTDTPAAITLASQLPAMAGNTTKILTNDGTVPSWSSVLGVNDAAGQVLINGSGRRIIGDFSNATITNRTLFQTSNTNTATYLGVIPNGTNTRATVQVIGGSDPTNASLAALNVIPALGLTIVESAAFGSGTWLPMAFYVNNGERLRISTDGNASMAGTLVMGSHYSHRNKLINGDFTIAQRATNISTAPTSGVPAYGSLDRWWYAQSGTTSTMTFSQNASVSAVTNRYGMRMSRNSGQTNTASIYCGQTLESWQVIQIAGKRCTLSFKAMRGADAPASLNVYVRTGTTSDQGSQGGFGGTWAGYSQLTFVTGTQVNTISTSTLDRFSVTFDVPAGTKEMLVMFGYVPTGTAGANEWYQIEEVQLEEGSAPTPFEYRPLTIEQQLCYRYYYRLTPGNTGGFGSSFGVSTTTAYGFTTFPVPMRAAPSLSTSGTANQFEIWNTSAVVCSAVPTLHTATTINTTTIFTFASGITVGAAAYLRSNNASAYLAWSSEL
jgi:hypothetical protein